MAIHAENQAKAAAIHDEVVDLLRDLHDGEVVLSTDEVKSEQDMHDAIVNAGKDRKEMREEKANKWATSHEAETQFRTKMVDSTERMESHMAKVIEMESRRLSLFEHYVIAIEKQAGEKHQ